MTLTQIAIRALTRNHYINIPTSRRQRIANRFKLVFVQDLSEWILKDNAWFYEPVGVWVSRSAPRTMCACSEETPSMYMQDMICGSGWRNAYTAHRCSICANQDAWSCDNCGIYVTDDLSPYSINNSDYCNGCYNRHMDRMRVHVPAYHHAQRWDLDDIQKPSYSMEWEIVAGNRQKVVDILQASSIQKLSWESDGSLPSGRGLEMLLQHRHSTDALAEDAIKLSSLFYRQGCEISAWGFRDSEGSPSAGIHINSNRDARFVSRIAVARVLFQVSVHRDLISKIAGRNSNRWACFPNRQDKHMLKAWSNGNFGKYLAVRVGTDRMEWRCFRSTMSRDRLKLYCDTVRVIEDLACSKLSGRHLVAESRKQLQQLLDKAIKNSSH